MATSLPRLQMPPLQVPMSFVSSPADYQATPSLLPSPLPHAPQQLSLHDGAAMANGAMGLNAPYYPTSHPYHQQRVYHSEPVRPIPQYANLPGPGLPSVYAHLAPGMMRSSSTPSATSSVHSNDTHGLSRSAGYRGESHYFAPMQHHGSTPGFNSPGSAHSSNAPPLSPMISPFHSTTLKYYPNSHNGNGGSQHSESTSPGLPRGRIGHATTPSLHPASFPGRGVATPSVAHHNHQPRQGSMSLRPGAPGPSMRSHGRTGSLSPGALPTSVVEKKKKSVHVRVPNESGAAQEDVEAGADTIEDGDDDEMEAKDAGKKKRSLFVRNPLDGEAKRMKLVQISATDIGVAWSDLTSRPVHFDEIRANALPPTIEIFLPGREAWEDVREQLGLSPPHSPMNDRAQLLSSRLSSFLDKLPSALSPGGHQRSNSLFGGPPSFPPRLQSAIDSFTRHASAQSVSGPLTRGFTMPQWAQSLAASAPRVLDQFERGLLPAPGVDTKLLLSPSRQSSNRGAIEPPRAPAPRPSKGLGIFIEEFGEPDEKQPGPPGEAAVETRLAGDRDNTSPEEDAPTASHLSQKSSMTTPKGSGPLRLSIDTQVTSSSHKLGVVIFEAPADIDKTPEPASPVNGHVTQGNAAPKPTPHKMTQTFEFPPRSTPAKQPCPPSPKPDNPTEQQPPAGATAHKFSLNVAAPEFVFGAASTGKFGSQAKELPLTESAGFGPLGSPGSLAATDEPSPHSPPPPMLNPLAGEFQPTFGAIDSLQPHKFDFKPPADAPQIVLPRQSPRTSSAEKSPQVVVAGSGHGPLPLLPLTTVTHSTHVKRQKLEGGSYSLAQFKSQLELRSPLPKNPTLAEVEREHGDDPPSSPTPAGPSVGQYFPSRSEVWNKTPNRRPTSDRLFTLRPAASFSADGRLIGFRQRISSAPPDRRPVSQVGDSASSMGAVPRMREYSVDDIALPNGSRPWSKAIAIPQPEDNKMVIELVPQTDEEALDAESGVGSNESSLQPHSSSDDLDDLESANGESPLEILENLLAGYFEALRSELSKAISVRRTVEEQDRNDLLDGLVDRVVTSILDSRIVGVESIEHELGKLHASLEEGQRQTHDSVCSVVQNWLEEGRGKPHVEASWPHVTAPFGVDTNVKLRDEIVAAVSTLLQERGALDDRSAPTTKGGASQEIIKAVELATQPLHKAFAASRRTESIAEWPSSTETANIAQHIADKVESSSALLKNAMSLLEELKNNSASSTDVDALFEYLRRPQPPSIALDTNGLASLDLSTFSARLAFDLQPRLDELAQEVKLTAIASSFDIDALIARIATEIRSAQPRDVWSTSLEALVQAHQKLERYGSELGANQQSLNVAVASLQSSLVQQLERLGTKIETQVMDVVTSSDAVAKVADLELQLAKARSDHGKARSEKASMTERFDMERGQLMTQYDALKAEIERRNEADQAVDAEKALLTGAIDRLEQALSSSISNSAHLETALAAITLRQDADKLEQDERDETLVALRTELDRAKADAELSAREVQLLLAESARLAAELAELREAHERLSNQKHEDDQIRRAEREAAAKLAGEIGALEKRIAGQDDKISSLQLLKSKQQQALAQANQRTVELKNRAAEVDAAETRISELITTTTSLEERLAASEAVRELLVRDSTEYRQQTESELESVRDTVARELEGKEARIRALESEREQLSQEYERLEALNLELSDALRKGSVRLALSTSSESATPARSVTFGACSSYPSPQTLELQRTGGSIDSTGTIVDEHRSPALSPTPSTLAGRALVVDESGWWSAE